MEEEDIGCWGLVLWCRVIILSCWRAFALDDFGVVYLQVLFELDMLHYTSALPVGEVRECVNSNVRSRRGEQRSEIPELALAFGNRSSALRPTLGKSARSLHR